MKQITSTKRHIATTRCEYRTNEQQVQNSVALGSITLLYNHTVVVHTQVTSLSLNWSRNLDVLRLASCSPSYHYRYLPSWRMTIFSYPFHASAFPNHYHYLRSLSVSLWGLCRDSPSDWRDLSQRLDGVVHFGHPDGFVT